MHPVSVRVRVRVHAAASSPSSRGPLSYRQTRRQKQKQLLGFYCMYIHRSLRSLGFWDWDSRILPGPAAERVPRPASRWPGCPFLSAAVLASWKPLFGSRTLSRRLFFSHRCQQTQWEKMRKNGITVCFFCNDEHEYAVGCVDRRLSSQKRRRVHEAIHTSGPQRLLFCLIRGGCQSEVLHHLDSPYIYDCRATAMLVAEAGPLVAMIYRRRPWRGPAVARESKIARHMLFMVWPSHHPSGRHRRDGLALETTCSYMYIHGSYSYEGDGSYSNLPR
ncbi:hypothetical protein CI102_10150 [Trichoderma harzianum]|nr:hypothetical protein CI102_10150 [Trichoderma harzianum]